MKNTVLDRVLIRFQVAYKIGYSGLLIFALFLTQVQSNDLMWRPYDEEFHKLRSQDLWGGVSLIHSEIAFWKKN